MNKILCFMLGHDDDTFEVHPYRISGVRCKRCRRIEANTWEDKAVNDGLKEMLDRAIFDYYLGNIW